MQINENYQLESDKWQWILKSRYLGKDKDGNPKYHWKETYHRTLDQVAEKVVNLEAKKVDSLEQILVVLPELIGQLSKSLESATGGR